MNSSIFGANRYIDEEDLLRFMIREEVDIVFPLFEGAESGRIERKALTDWVVSYFPLFLSSKLMIMLSSSTFNVLSY